MHIEITNKKREKNQEIKENKKPICEFLFTVCIISSAELDLWVSSKRGKVLAKNLCEQKMQTNIIYKADRYK